MGLINTVPSLIWQVLEGVGADTGWKKICSLSLFLANTEIPYRLPFWREFCWVLQVRVASGVNTEFPYRVRGG